MSASVSTPAGGCAASPAMVPAGYNPRSADGDYSRRIDPVSIIGLLSRFYTPTDHFGIITRRLKYAHRGAELWRDWTAR